MSEPNQPGTLPTLGDERVLRALARTRQPMGPVDLSPRPAEAGSAEHRYTEVGLLGRGGLGEVVEGLGEVVEALDEDLRRAIPTRSRTRGSALLSPALAPTNADGASGRP